jgi:hypothetical protein
MKLFSPLCLIALFPLASLHGQDVPPAFERAEVAEAAPAEEEMLDPFDPTLSAPKMLRVQVEFIEMAHKDLTRLMMEDKSETADATALRMKLQEMVDSEKAKILDTQVMVARSGQKGTVEAIHEFMYPTEYEPPTLPKAPDGEKQVPDFPVTPSNPTAFETKNVGSTLEIEPTLGSDDKLIDLRFLPELTWHAGDNVWSEIKDPLGNVTKVSMPDFYKVSINTSITCIDGQYMMVGVVSPKDQAGETDPEQKVMIFVKCKVLPVVP